ncbi:MAG: hypothetical protein LUD72_12080 [Bacteroidales bacterium]|nr:hypothetical protein [Bacteroidales bacterium]
MARFDVNLLGITEMANKVQQYGAKGERAINEYFQSEGFERVAPHIQGLIHASGRTFKGHSASATSASYNSVFGKETGNLSLTIKSHGKYRYLYFPDDGSNTKHHAGNQQFMRRGAEEALPSITEDITKRLVQAFEEA